MHKLGANGQCRYYWKKIEVFCTGQGHGRTRHYRGELSANPIKLSVLWIANGLPDSHQTDLAVNG